MESSSGAADSSDSTVERRHCHELNRAGVVARARRGETHLIDHSLKDRRDRIERWKRDAERESVEYPATASVLLGRVAGKSQRQASHFSSTANCRQRSGPTWLFAAVLPVALVRVATTH